MRRTWIAGLSLLVALSQVGCSASGASPTPASPVRAVPSPTVAPHPSTDPVVVSSGAAYRTAADAYNAAVQKASVGWDRRIFSQAMTPAVKAHYKAMADAESTFATALRAVTFPGVMRLHIKSLLDATDAAAALDLKATRTPMGAQVDATPIFVANSLSSTAADLVRRDFKVFGVDF